MCEEFEYNINISFKNPVGRRSIINLNLFSILILHL